MGVNVVTSQMDSEQARSVMQTLLANLLEQQQWALAMPVAHWLAANGDDLACALCPQLHNYLDEYELSLEALSAVPIALRRRLVVRRLKLLRYMHWGITSWPEMYCSVVPLRSYCESPA